MVPQVPHKNSNQPSSSDDTAAEDMQQIARVLNNPGNNTCIFNNVSGSLICHQGHWEPLNQQQEMPEGANLYVFRNCKITTMTNLSYVESEAAPAAAYEEVAAEVEGDNQILGDNTQPPAEE